MPRDIPQNPDVHPASWLERSGVKTLIVLLGTTLVERVLAHLTGLDAPWAPYAAAVIRALWDVFRGPPSYRQDGDAPAVVVRPLRGAAPLLLLAALLAGCVQPRLDPPAPGPRPSPGPVAPVDPRPVGRVVSQAEFEAVPLGSAEEVVTGRFGAPVRVVPLGPEGVRVFVYPGSTPTDPTRTAEFWYRDGRLVNKVLY